MLFGSLHTTQLFQGKNHVESHSPGPALHIPCLNPDSQAPRLHLFFLGTTLGTLESGHFLRSRHFMLFKQSLPLWAYKAVTQRVKNLGNTTKMSKRPRKPSAIHSETTTPNTTQHLLITSPDPFLNVVTHPGIFLHHCPRHIFRCYLKVLGNSLCWWCKISSFDFPLFVEGKRLMMDMVVTCRLHCYK